MTTGMGVVEILDTIKTLTTNTKDCGSNIFSATNMYIDDF